MKKYIKCLLVATISFSFTSCNDLFLEAPVDKITETYIWGNPMLLDEYVLPWYRNMSNGFNTYVPANALLKGMSRYYMPWFGDQVVPSNSNLINSSGYGDIIKGNTLTLTNYTRWYWPIYYAQIRSINFLFENEGNIASGSQKQRILGEAHFFRAYYYYMLWRQWGGVMLIDKVFDPLKSKEKFPRASYHEMVDAIVKDAKMAADLLPLSYESNETGRITKGAALMLIAKTYLWAAGEQYQNKGKDYLGFLDDQSQSMLEKAKVAYENLFALNQYQLIEIGGTTEDEIKKEYRKIFLTKNSPESILEVQHSNDGNYATGFGHKLDRDAASPYFTGTTAYYTPTQNHVDEYELRTATGRKEFFKYKKNEVFEDNPYEGRDYRFYANILYDGSVWNGHTMNMHTTNGVKGVDITKYGESENAYYTQTGYYMAKFLDETQSIDNNSTYASKQNYIIWRYAEALLDYAEVMFKLGNTSAALDNVNKIRSRVKMHTLGSISWDDIYNERRVEMAFEETTYWDMLRWGTAKNICTDVDEVNPLQEINPLKKISITYLERFKVYEYKVENKGQAMRDFNLRQYYLPIHWDDVKYHKVEQNPDWTKK